MKKAISAFLFSGILSTFANAVPIIDGEISAGYIKQDISGWIQYKGDKIDVEKDLRLGNENSYFVKLKLEHSVPILPNLKFQFLNMSFSGTGKVSKNFTFGNITVNVNNRVHTDLDMDHYDIILFYNLPFISISHILDAELGLNVRVVDFYAKVKDLDTGYEDSKSGTIPIPMLHASVEFKPISYFSILAEGNGVAYEGSSFYDITGELRIKPFRSTVVDLFLGLGYKYEKIKIDDISDVSSDIKIKQPFIEAGVLF